MSNFLINYYTLFTEVTPFSIPTSKEHGFQFLHVFVNAYYFLMFSFSFLKNNSHPTRYEGLSHCGFICIAVMISDTEYLFMYLLPFVYLLWGSVYSSHLPIF